MILTDMFGKRVFCTPDNVNMMLGLKAHYQKEQEEIEHKPDESIRRNFILFKTWLIENGYMFYE